MPQSTHPDTLSAEHFGQPTSIADTNAPSANVDLSSFEGVTLDDRIFDTNVISETDLPIAGNRRSDKTDGFDLSLERYERVSSLLSIPPQPRPLPQFQVAFHALQEWEGYVLRVDQNEFCASLVDLTGGATYESDEAVIPIEEISERDAKRIVVGSIFRWVIGYERSPEGTRKRVSQFVFRNLPRISERDYENGKKWARKVLQSINP